MRLALLLATAGVLVGGVALGQQPAQIGTPLTAAGDTRAADLDQLRATVAHLQERVDQLTGSSAAPAVAPAPARAVYLAAPQEKPLPPSVLVPAPPADEAAPATQPSSTPMIAAWQNGLRIRSKDDVFTMHVGGNLQLDAGWNAAGPNVQSGSGGIGDLQDGALFRRAQLQIDGTLYQHIEWMASFDFANSVENDTETSTQQVGSPSFVDVWIGVNDLPVLGTVRAGWMKEPISFEHLTSSRWLNFMELAPGSNSLSLTSPGILLRNTDEDKRVTWAAGVFHVQDDNFGFGFGDGQYAETGRLTWLAYVADDNRELLHLGIGASHRHLDDDQLAIRGRPSIRTMPGSLEPSLADTGTILGTTQDVVDVELAAVAGPWTLQSEYYSSWIHDAVFPDQPAPAGMPRGTLFYQGAYVELLYFLTGEVRAYERTDATFGRVVPLRNFNVWDEGGGWGAWQVGIRYAYLDLQDKGVNGATLHDIVLGLNWFLNPNTKVQWNVAMDHRDSTPAGSSGWTYIVGSRLALDF